MIRLVSVFPEALNLNGDQANLRVLSEYFHRCGQKVETIGVTSAAELVAAKPNLVFFGHGSQAAHRAIDSELLSMGKALGVLDSAAMFVGSSVEFAIEHLNLSSQKISRSERESLFSVGQFHDISVLGYRNTDSGLPDVWAEGKFLFTMLHGPVLAKNPRLQHWIASQIGDSKIDHSNREWLDSLNQLCEKIWLLETDKKFEGLDLS